MNMTERQDAEQIIVSMDIVERPNIYVNIDAS